VITHLNSVKKSLHYFARKTLLLLVAVMYSFSALGEFNKTQSDIFRQLNRKLLELTFDSPQLDFSEFLKRQLSREQQPLDPINSFQIQLEGYTANNLCESIALADLNMIAKLAVERVELLNSYSDRKANYDGNFSDLPKGKQWYLHWLKSWLMADVSLQDLEKMALSELESVAQTRRNLAQKDLPVNDQRIARSLKNEIIQSFRHREQQINTQLNTVFGFPVPPNSVKIIESNLPKSFPAPGIYNAETEEFIYHLQSDDFLVKHMDWLFLHEGVPGHHYQSQIAADSPHCTPLSANVQSSIFAEGWGAYVETLGETLGLYTDRSSYSYALDWQALRAVRVLIDIGIHHHGWSDSQAKDLWMRYIPEQQSIMEREIKRIHRWPAQVITYVYGKSQIQQAINKQIDKMSKRDLKDIHRGILSLTNYSINALKHLDQLLNSKRDNQ